MISQSLWMFCPSGKKDHSGDYHKVFNGENYVNWFKHNLLPNLNEPSITILDDARYHKRKPLSAGNPNNMRKSEILEVLKDPSIDHDGSITVTEARLILRNWQNTNIEPEICILAEEQDHKVIFTPPHFSDLQTIEYVWAVVKGGVAKKYTKSTSLEDVRSRLLHQFEPLGIETGRECISSIMEHVDKPIDRFQADTASSEEIENLIDNETESGSSIESSITF